MSEGEASEDDDVMQWVGPILRAARGLRADWGGGLLSDTLLTHKPALIRNERRCNYNCYKLAKSGEIT